MTQTGVSDIHLTVEDLDILVADCRREQHELKALELEKVIGLNDLRRQLRGVAQELEYVQMLSAAQLGEYDTMLTEPLCKVPAPVSRYRSRSVLGTLTLRHSKLVLARAKSFKLDED